ncbi:MAG: DUF115 domain-containing protein [Spirochaetia bacterium]|nr:DUF115 domain-containing protein [Spirochaetia bacterium]
MPARIEWVQARRNGKTLLVDGQARSSRYDPVEEGKRLLENAGLKPDSMLVFLGIAPAYHILQAAKDGLEFFIVEAHPDLRSKGATLLGNIENEGASVRPDSFWSNKFSAAAEGEQAARDVIARIPDLGKMMILENPSSPKTQAEESFYQAFHASLKKLLLDEVKRRSTENHFAKRWVRNAVQTICGRDEITLLSDLELNHRGEDPRTAVLVSSGLSVEADLPRLQEISKRMPTFALPGVFPLLRENDVVIDALISTDGGYYNSCHFEAVSNASFSGILIVPFSIHPSIPDRIKKTFFYFDDIELANILAPEDSKGSGAEDVQAFGRVVEANWIPMAGTAVVNALQILKKLGFTKVVTSGIDFALSPFKAHAVSNITEERFFSEGGRFATFETKYHRAFPMKLEALETPGSGLTHIDEKLKLYRRLALEEARRMDLVLIPYGTFQEAPIVDKEVRWGNTGQTNRSRLLKKVLREALPAITGFFQGTAPFDSFVMSKVRNRIALIS